MPYIPPVVFPTAVTELRSLAGNVVTAHAILANKLALVGRNTSTELLLAAKAAEESTFAASACFRATVTEI